MSLHRGWVLAVLLCLAWEASGDASALAYSEKDKCEGSLGSISAPQGQVVRKDLSQVAHSIFISKIDEGCGIILYASKGSNGQSK